jgi:hypothetical protein
MSFGEVMAIMFWDHRGVLLIDLMQQGATINAGTYYAALTCLLMAIK